MSEKAKRCDSVTFMAKGVLDINAAANKITPSHTQVNQRKSILQNEISPAKSILEHMEVGGKSKLSYSFLRLEDKLTVL